METMNKRRKKPASEDQLQAFRKALRGLGENAEELRETLQKRGAKRKPPPKKGRSHRERRFLDLKRD
jgi:hypothetical protein